jgi:hypothetical protein
MIDDARERRETMTIGMEAERPAVTKPQVGERMQPTA